MIMKLCHTQLLFAHAGKATGKSECFYKFTLVLHGMAMSTNLRGESVLQKAMTGMLTYEASVIG